MAGHENFFELGGHSLLATRVITRISHVLDVDLPLRVMFEKSTIEGLSNSIVQQIAADVSTGGYEEPHGGVYSHEQLRRLSLVQIRELQAQSAKRGRRVRPPARQGRGRTLPLSYAQGRLVVY